MTISSKTKTILIIAVLLLIVILIGFYAYTRREAAREEASPLGQAFADNASSTRVMIPNDNEVSFREYV